jgi:hypothetical protein
MQGLTRGNPLDRFGQPPSGSGNPAAASATVGWVAHDRVSYMLEMNPYLMGSAGMQFQPEQVKHLEAGHHARFRPGRPAPRGYHHSLTILRVPSDAGVYAGGAVEMAPHQGGVTAAYPPGRQRGTESTMRQVGLGDQH